MKKRNKRLLFELNEIREPNTNLVLLRAVLDSDYTRLDFGYIATSEFVKGGWIRIAPQTYIRIEGDSTKYTLNHAENIPLSPELLHFESNKDWQYFSLYFPVIPQKDCRIDIIETENPNDNDFNYYGIELNTDNAVEIINLN